MGGLRKCAACGKVSDTKYSDGKYCSRKCSEPDHYKNFKDPQTHWLFTYYDRNRKYLVVAMNRGDPRKNKNRYRSRYINAYELMALVADGEPIQILNLSGKDITEYCIKNWAGHYCQNLTIAEAIRIIRFYCRSADGFLH